MASFISSLVAIMKGAVALKALGDQFTAAWVTYQDAKIDAQYDNKKAERDLYTFALTNAPNDEARKVAFRKLIRMAQQ